MAQSERHSLQPRVSSLNEHIDEFNQFTTDNGYSDDFHSIHYLGTQNPHEIEASLIDHWDEFIQFSQEPLNMDNMPRDKTLELIDLVNVHYKRVLESITTI